MVGNGGEVEWKRVESRTIREGVGGYGVEGNGVEGD